MHTIVINKDKCINCGACSTLCYSAKVYKFDKKEVHVASPELCWECGQCIAACPKSAIEHSSFKTLSTIISDPSNINVLTDCFRTRRSVRFFQNKSVDRDIINELIDISRYVPIAQNEQSVEWFCIDNKEKIKALSLKSIETLNNTAKLLKNPLLKPLLKVTLGSDKFKKATESTNNFKKLIEKSSLGEDPIFYDAPVLLFTHTPKGDYFGKENSVYIMYNLMLAAQQKGLGTCRIGYFDVALERNPSLKDLIGIKSDREIQTAIILGYPKYKFCNTFDRKAIQVTYDK